jgi:hypothetical protein
MLDEKVGFIKHRKYEKDESVPCVPVKGGQEDCHRDETKTKT